MIGLGAAATTCELSLDSWSAWNRGTKREREEDSFFFDDCSSVSSTMSLELEAATASADYLPPAVSSIETGGEELPAPATPTRRPTARPICPRRRRPNKSGKLLISKGSPIPRLPLLDLGLSQDSDITFKRRLSFSGFAYPASERRVATSLVHASLSRDTRS